MLDTRFLVPGNTYTKNSYRDLTPFLAENDGEKWSRKNYFEIPWWPSEIPANLGRFFCTGQQKLLRPLLNFKMIFSRPLFTITFKPKIVSNLCKNFLCIVWHPETYSVLRGTKFEDEIVK